MLLRTFTLLLIFCNAGPLLAQEDNDLIEIVEEGEEMDEAEVVFIPDYPGSFMWMGLSEEIAVLSAESLYLHSPCDSFRLQAFDSTDQLLIEYVRQMYSQSYEVKAQNLINYLPIDTECLDSMVLTCRHVSDLASRSHKLSTKWDSNNSTLYVRDLVHAVYGPNDAVFKIDESGKILYALSLQSGIVQDSVSFSYNGCELVEVHNYVFRHRGGRKFTGVCQMSFDKGRLIRQHWYNLDSGPSVVRPLEKYYHYIPDGKLRKVETHQRDGGIEYLIFSYDSKGMTVDRIESSKSDAVIKMRFRLEGLN